jgi:hypothetical protein
MSRDLTPHEWQLSYKEIFKRDTNICLNTVWVTKNEDGTETRTPMVSDEEKVVFGEFPTLSCIGYRFLIMCMKRHIHTNEYGNVLLHQLEDYLTNDTEIPDKELLEKVKLWYDGKLEPGHCLEDNDMALVRVIQNKMKEIADG